MSMIIDGTNGLTFNNATTQASAGLVAGGTIATGTVTTLTTTTLSDGTNSTSSTNAIKGSAKAWAKFNNSGTISASYNVSSITVNSTGYYTVNLTNALPNADYAAIATATASTGSNGNVTATVFTDNSGNAVTPTTTTYAINTGVYGVGQFATRFVCTAVFD